MVLHPLWCPEAAGVFHSSELPAPGIGGGVVPVWLCPGPELCSLCSFQA